MPQHIVHGAPPTDGLNAGVPMENLTGTKGHPSSQGIVKAAPAAIKSLSADSFTDSQPSGGVDVKSGQGPV